LLLLLAATSVAHAGGNSPGHLVEHGWYCFVVNDRAHCAPPGWDASTTSLPIKVFETPDLGATDAEMLWTDLAIRADLYASQPCQWGGGTPYQPVQMIVDGLPVDYMLCRHADLTK
jgi:hypothetical protein